MFRYLIYIITFSSKKTLSKVKTREVKSCNYVKTFQKRGTSRSSTFQCHWKSRADDAIWLHYLPLALLSKGSLLQLASQRIVAEIASVNSPESQPRGQRKAANSGLERRKSDINLGFTRISYKKHFCILAFESLSNLL